MATTATSPCGLVTVHADRPDNPDAAHLFLSARTRSGKPPRWKATLGGDLPVELLAAMTTVLTAELLRDPDYILYNLPSDGRLVALPGPGLTGWGYQADPNLVEGRPTTAVRAPWRSCATGAPTRRCSPAARIP